MNIATKTWLQKIIPGASLKLFKVNPEFQSLELLVRQLPDKFQSFEQIIYKARNELKLIETEQGKLVIKYFDKIYLANRFIYAWFRPSKAERSFNNALRLLEKGVNTPLPVGYVENFSNGILQESMFVYEYCANPLNMRGVFGEEHYPDRENLLREFTRFTYFLNQSEVFHRDYSPGNILFEQRDGHYHFTLVDINRLSFGAVDERKKYRVFRRLKTDLDALRIIGREYARLYDDDEQEVIDKLISHHEQFIQKKARKKRLKRLVRLG